MTTTRNSLIGLVLASASLLGFVSGLEGNKPTAYADKLAGGLPTVCFGHTGPEVHVGDVWSKERCDATLVKDVRVHGDGILKCIKVPISQNEYDGITTLAFNVGVGEVCRSSIPAKFLRGDRAAACKTILDFGNGRNYNAPKVLNARTGKMEHPLIKIASLQVRRGKEYALCIKPVVPVLGATA